MQQPRRIFNWLVPVALGLMAFGTVVGWRAADPANVAWLLSSDDQAESYLGWVFYRDASPGAVPGSNDKYGLELSSGVFYADVVPLIALPLKHLSDLLPQPFQYTGLWLMTCFVLQATMAWLLLAALPLTLLQRACATVLFLFAPPLLFRVGSHNDLCAHWLILCGLALSLSRPSRYTPLGWVLLMAAASLIHSYLFAMVAILWAGDVVRRAFIERTSPLLMAAEGVAVLGLTGTALWAAGFFTVSSGMVESGFGRYKMNLLSPIDSSGWSYVLPDIGEGKGDYEGFNFLGLGLLLVAAVAVYLVIRQRDWRRIPRTAWPLIGAATVLTLYAISNVITIGPHDVEIPLPAAIIDAANVLRSSGRMFWPVFYLVTLVAIWVVATHFSGTRVLTALLAIAAVVQVADTSAGWRQRRAVFAIQGSDIQTTMRAGAWQDFARHYARLRVVPLERWTDDWRELTYFAGRHGLGTDAARLSRVDEVKLKERAEAAQEAVRSGSYDADSFYVIDHAASLLAASSLRKGDLMRDIDGRVVVAPRFCLMAPENPLCEHQNP